MLENVILLEMSCSFLKRNFECLGDDRDNDEYPKHLVDNHAFQHDSFGMLRDSFESSDSYNNDDIFNEGDTESIPALYTCKCIAAWDLCRS